MGTKEGRCQIEGAILIQYVECLKHAELGINLETIAGFCFSSGCAVSKHRLEVWFGLLNHGFQGCLTGSTYSGKDTSAGL